MGTFDRNPIQNIINEGIRRGIEVAIESNCIRSALILIYTGIDALAFLDMPKDNLRVTTHDFIKWADRYIRFDYPEAPTAKELYKARCGFVHSYGLYAEFEMSNEVRGIGYMVGGLDCVYNRKAAPGLVFIDVHYLKRKFFEGMNIFIMNAYSDAAIIPVLEARLKTMFAEIPYSKGED
jgi:hypothetical protein